MGALDGCLACGKPRSRRRGGAVTDIERTVAEVTQIRDPQGRHESVYLTDEGLRGPKMVAVKHFGAAEPASAN